MQRLLIAGCGYVGTALAAHLHGEAPGRWEIFGLRRDVTALPAGVAKLAADLHAPDLAARLPPGRLAAVVFCVAAAARDQAAYARAYVDASAALLRALGDRRTPHTRLLFTSSTAVYEHDDGRWVDATTPVAPQHFRGRTLLAAETAWRAAGGCVVRLSGIYGPGRAALVAQVRAGGAAALVAAPQSFGNRIHREDCAGILGHLLDGAPPPPVTLASDCLPATRGEVAAYIAQRLGMAVPAAPLDARLGTAVPAAPPDARLGTAVPAAPPDARLGTAVPAAPPAAAAGRVGTTVSAAAADAAARGRRCDVRALAARGYRWRFPSYREGYAALLGA